jgi:hypothetical protein
MATVVQAPLEMVEEVASLPRRADQRLQDLMPPVQVEQPLACTTAPTGD